MCVTFLGKFIESLDKDTKSSQEKVETAFKKFCKGAKKDDNRFVSLNFKNLSLLPLIMLYGRYLDLGIRSHILIKKKTKQ